MLASINPLGERARHNRFVLTAGAYVCGSVLGGAALGAIAGGVGFAVAMSGLPAATVLGVAAVTTIATALAEARPGRRMPGPRRQVDDAWLNEYRGWVYGAGFGVQLGAALTTRINTAAVYLMVLFAVLTGSATAGLVVGVAFGFVRAVPVMAVVGIREPEGLRARLGRLIGWERPSRTLTALTLTVLSVVLAVGFVSEVSG